MEGDNRRQLEEKKKTRPSLLEEKLTEALTLLLQLRSKVHRLSHTRSLPSSGSSIITLGFGASSGQTRVSAFKLDQNMHENNVEVLKYFWLLNVFVCTNASHRGNTTCVSFQNVSRRALGKIVMDTLDVCSRSGDGTSLQHLPHYTNL